MAKQPKGLMVAIGIPKGGSGGPDDSGPFDGSEQGAKSGAGPEQDCVPLDALAMPDSDNGDQMAPPEVGDVVQYTVEGKVTSIEGANACIERTTINGQPVGQDPGEASPEDQAAAADQAEGAGLRGEAEQMSGMGGQSQV